MLDRFGTEAGLGICSFDFRANCSFLSKNEQISDLLKNMSDLLIGSFLVSELSNWLTIAHFL